ncbi:MAG TPA: hypothetical protein VFZ48_05365 [Candidatus Saccharimonadales bacterium]
MSKKREGFTFGLSALVVIGLIFSIINHQQADPAQPPKDVVSSKRTITLYNIAPGNPIRQGGTIRGLYKPAKDEVLSYKCITSSGALIARGNIIAKPSGHFESELDFTRPPKQAETVQLEVFSQDHRGKQVDSLSIDARYQ